VGRIVCGIMMLLWVTPLLAQSKRIVTYIEDVQEERRSTRWTLTEWLLIKERMKMMDVWLAMFSDPEKDKFAPELSLSGYQGPGASRFRLGTNENFVSDRVEQEAKHRLESGLMQFWFTNLVSSSTGLRTLDIDLGLEAAFQNRFMDTNQLVVLANPAVNVTTDTDRLQRAGVNFRIFGASSQDSGLVAKLGKFQREAGYTGAWSETLDGTYYGGELSLYLLSFVGAEGQYYHYKPSLEGDAKAQGRESEYLGFIEIYNVRFGYGIYQKDWRLEDQGLQFETREQGRFYLLRLYL